MIGNFEYTKHTPSRSEMDSMNYVENRRKQMDTNYRKKLVDLADWAKKEYDSLPQSRVSNLELFKTGLSRAAVNHRLVMLYDNPSEAIYKSEEDSDQYRIEILKQVDLFDKGVSRFAAIHQQIERTANIEGTAIGMLRWHEVFEGEVTIGSFGTMTDIIPLKDFYWDDAGIFLNGNSAFTCNDAGYGKVYSMSQFRQAFPIDSEEFKNIESVMPNKENISQETWNEDWEEGRFSTDGDYVYVFILKIKKFWEGGKFVDKEFIVANGQLIYEGVMREPWIAGEKWLPFFKVEGIPTGGFGGIGIPAIIRHPQEVLDRMLTMAEAQAELAVNPVLFYQTSGELLPDQIEYLPGAAYPYKGTGQGITNDLTFLQQPDVTAGAQYIINKMIEIITITSGIDISSLIDTGSELAIQTQNKREVQEKILKMSVLWNETHGWSDMATIRLAYLQEYYPAPRIQRIIGHNGVPEEKIDYPKIKVDGFLVQKSFVEGRGVNTLVKKQGAYSSLSITEELRFPVDVMIQSSQMASGVDTVMQNKWDKMLDSLARVPGIENTIDPEKASRGTVKKAGFKASEILQDRLNEISDDTHPAKQEFKAILVSEAIPFEPITPEKYMPEEYLFVFRDMMKLPEYKKAPAPVKQLVQERLQFHMTNFTDPYFKEKQKREKEQGVINSAQEAREQGNSLKALGGNNEPPTDLAGRVKSDAAKVGAETKEAKKTL